MSRIYQSARDTAARAGMDEKALQGIQGTGADGAVTKRDVEAYLEGQADQRPTKEELIRRGLAEGLPNEEIGHLVRETLGEDVPWDNGYVSWTVGDQRRRNTEWWRAHGPRIVAERGVKPGELAEDALADAREKYGEEE